MAGAAEREVCGFGSLHKAMAKCRRGVGWKDSVSRYTNNGLASIFRLRLQLINGTYAIDPYFSFIIHEPKRREIVSTKFKDRVFQRSLCDNYLYREISRQFIYDNAACQLGRGTDFARNRLKAHLQRYYRKHGSDGYVLKIDFRNYFGSTPHATAKKALRKAVRDDWAYGCACMIVDTYGSPESPDVGLGLGSQITQLVQLLVLSGLDHRMKECMGVRHYVRYMDDIIILHHDKGYLARCLDAVEGEAEALGLTLNRRKTGVFRISQGIPFLGFRHTLTDTGKVVSILLKKNVARRKRKLKKYAILTAEGRMTKDKADQCYRSWKAHAGKGDTGKVLRVMDSYRRGLWEELACSNF